MYILISLIHVLLCLILILVVLLQTGKGSDLASAFGGGGAQAMFGGRGPASLLNKMTTVVALLYMATSVALAYLSSNRSTSIMGDMAEPEVVQQVTPETGSTDSKPLEEGQPAESSTSDTQESAPAVKIDDAGGSTNPNEQPASSGSQGNSASQPESAGAGL